MTMLAGLVLASACGAREDGDARSERVAAAPEAPGGVTFVIEEPASFDAIPTPYVNLRVRVVSQEGTLLVNANGLGLGRKGNVYRSITPVPLLRQGGAIRLVAMDSVRTWTLCVRYRCAIGAEHEVRALDALRDLESENQQIAAGAYLKLKSAVDIDLVPGLISRLSSSSDPRVRRRVAMLCGDWRALDAVPTLLTTIREDPVAKVREGCLRALCQMGPDYGPIPYDCTESRVPAGAENELRRWLEPLIPALRAAQFPTECDGREGETIEVRR